MRNKSFEQNVFENHAFPRKRLAKFLPSSHWLTSSTTFTWLQNIFLTLSSLYCKFKKLNQISVLIFGHPKNAVILECDRLVQGWQQTIRGALFDFQPYTTHRSQKQFGIQNELQNVLLQRSGSIIWMRNSNLCSCCVSLTMNSACSILPRISEVIKC